MKNLMSISLFVLLLGFLNVVRAQDAEQKVKQDAKKVGNKSAELGSKAKSKVVDKTYADKVGPDGQTVYIDKHSKYYWIDDKGHKKYVSKSQLKNKE
jgi:hypothetical protein